MKTVETILPAGKIVEMRTLPDGRIVVVQEMVTEDKKESVFCEDNVILIEAEKLSLDDEFMQLEPTTQEEKETKELIAEAIRKGVKNFYRPIIDPSFTKTGENICYEKGRGPAVGKSYNWWKKVAEEYCPERNSRLGTRLEYGAFLGVLIKKLVEEGENAKWAWNAVCNDSKELGHYWNSENAKHKFESTGSRCVCGFYDLANTCKILAEDIESGGFWLAGGYYNNFGNFNPLADLSRNNYRIVSNYNSVGWLVLS